MKGTGCECLGLRVWEPQLWELGVVGRLSGHEGATLPPVVGEWGYQVMSSAGPSGVREPA